MSPARTGRTAPPRTGRIGWPRMAAIWRAIASASTVSAESGVGASTGAAQSAGSARSGLGTAGHRSTRPGIAVRNGMWWGGTPRPRAASPAKTASTTDRIAGEDRNECSSAACCIGGSRTENAAVKPVRRCSNTAMSAPWKE